MDRQWQCRLIWIQTAFMVSVWFFSWSGDISASLPITAYWPPLWIMDAVCVCVCVCVCVFVCACHDLHCAVKGYHRARKTSVKQLVSKQMIFWGAWLSSSITLSSVWDGTALGLNVFKEKFSILYDLDFFQYVSPSSSSSKGSDQSADYEVLLAASGTVSVWRREEKRLAAP